MLLTLTQHKGNNLKEDYYVYCTSTDTVSVLSKPNANYQSMNQKGLRTTDLSHSLQGIKILKSLKVSKLHQGCHLHLKEEKQQ
jgi:hypothetical protein